MKKAGVEAPGAGSRTLRHSWAVRAKGTAGDFFLDLANKAKFTTKFADV
jgi:hypothetical protein